jgi:hypothetical protein
MGQCLFYRHSQPVLARLEPEQRYGREDIAGLADHIVAFSLAALERLAQGRVENDPAGGEKKPAAQPERAAAGFNHEETSMSY